MAPMTLELSEEGDSWQGDASWKPRPSKFAYGIFQQGGSPPRANGFGAFEDSPAAQRFRMPTSPPLLSRDPPSNYGHSEESPDFPSNGPLSGPLNGKRPVPASETTDQPPRPSDTAVNGDFRKHETTPPPVSVHTEGDRLDSLSMTPKHDRTDVAGWTASKVVDQLKLFQQQMKESHADLVEHSIQSATPLERRCHSGRDLFSSLDSTPVDREQGKTMRIKFKQHFVKTKKDNREEHHEAIALKTEVTRVPGYRYHHVEIKKNILTPNTPNLFTPHLRDLDPGQEAKYHEWLKDIESKDGQTGFRPMQREEKYLRTIQLERTSTVALFVDSWLGSLGIPGCTKSDLISYMARQDPTDAMTPKQRTDILNSQGKDPGFASRVSDSVVLFAEAFSQVFEASSPNLKKIRLRDVLLLDESVDSIMDTKPSAKEGNDLFTAEADDVVLDDASQAGSDQTPLDSSLATYTILGCLICFSHGCDHGEYKADNDRQAFSLCSGLRTIRKTLAKRHKLALEHPGHMESEETPSPCRRLCYRNALQQNGNTELAPFSEDEEEVLQALIATSNYTKVTADPICLAADLLERDCQTVFLHARRLGISLVRGPKPSASTRAKPLTWYDGNKKQLLGEWQDHLKTDPKVRQLIEPCFHAGPCAPDICSCVDAGLLCDRFCGCSAERCSYKYTGCSCRSLGKSCQQKQHEKPTCICILMSRECDPELCGPCGAFERADPARANDDELHQTGCQNTVMQRGASKALLLGESQLPDTMFGLFTAENIAQDDFVVEYVGEMISQDEGTRRESRRSDVFSQISSPSYLFTLLDDEGIWVDAAIYGNLSRYINHSAAREEGGCNITPRVMYVNGEFRIKFVAMRDIKAGEELFFDYGDQFPNLNSLMESAAGNKAGPGKRKRGRPRVNGLDGDAATRLASKAPARSRFQDDLEEDASAELMDDGWTEPRARPGTKKRKRRTSARDLGESGVRQKRFKQTKPDQSFDSSGFSDMATPERLQHLRRTKQALGTPNQSPQLPKPRGKRGGARPGSGRPRKHPRPAPKVSPASQEKQASRNEEPVSKQEAILEPQFQPITPPKVSERAQGKEVKDSEEDMAYDEYDEDGEGEGEDAAGKRQARSERYRRLPAKFREDDSWSETTK